MMSDSFFVVLPSNSSFDVYPDNKISSFKTHLASEIVTDPSKWEVALQEIQFPHTWFNIRAGKNVIHIEHQNLLPKEIEVIKELSQMKSAEAIFKGDGSVRRTITIPPGNYTTMDDMISTLRELEKDQPRPMGLVYKKIEHQVTVVLLRDSTLTWNDSDVARFLGFDPRDNITSTNEIERVSATIVNPERPFDSMYIYTDIVQSQSVGDYKVPLLRVIPIRSRFGDINWFHYDKPHFLQLNHEHINTIEVDIRDEKGDLVSFESGIVVITLVFKRKSVKFYQ